MVDLAQAWSVNASPRWPVEGYMTPVVGSLPPAARHCYHWMTGRGGDGARRMPVRHVPAKRRMIMTEHHEVRFFRQPRQQ